jgi:predicted NAD-dependent protein-ADP-ribosyltransferase YbiA (DUF1768 family)
VLVPTDYDGDLLLACKIQMQFAPKLFAAWLLHFELETDYWLTSEHYFQAQNLLAGTDKLVSKFVSVTWEHQVPPEWD